MKMWIGLTGKLGSARAAVLMTAAKQATTTRAARGNHKPRSLGPARCERMANLPDLRFLPPSLTYSRFVQAIETVHRIINFCYS
jgi:hypothetical protein